MEAPAAHPLTASHVDVPTHVLLSFNTTLVSVRKSKGRAIRVAVALPASNHWPTPLICPSFPAHRHNLLSAGFVYEHGPFDFKLGGERGFTLEDNPHSWYVPSVWMLATRTSLCVYQSFILATSWSKTARVYEAHMQMNGCWQEPIKRISCSPSEKVLPGHTGTRLPTWSTLTPQQVRVLLFSSGLCQTNCYRQAAL
jgi:hypothetical protein